MSTIAGTLGTEDELAGLVRAMHQINVDRILAYEHGGVSDFAWDQCEREARGADNVCAALDALSGYESWVATRWISEAIGEYARSALEWLVNVGWAEQWTNPPWVTEPRRGVVHLWRLDPQLRVDA